MTQEELKDVLSYEPDTGLFRWLINTNNQLEIGDVAGTKSTGYIRIRINNRAYMAHQLAFLYMTGSIPNRIDHKDQNGMNNAWNNLREATTSQNNCNSSIRSDNTSGIKGVSWCKRHNKFRARIALNKKTHYLGHYDDAEEARKVIENFRENLHGVFANNG